jgi:hypothetical protein
MWMKDFIACLEASTRKDPRIEEALAISGRKRTNRIHRLGNGGDHMVTTTFAQRADKN